MTKTEELETFLKSKEFLDELEGKESVEELQNIFSSHGFPMTADQVEELVQAVYSDNRDSELLEEDLCEVAGGVSLLQTISWCIKAWKVGWSLGEKFYDWEQKWS